MNTLHNPVRSRRSALIGLLWLVCALAGQSHRLAAQSYSIDWHKIAGGGGTSTNSQYSVSGTIGQPDASGTLAGGNYSLTGGFWSRFSVVQTPGAPLLSITYSGGQAVVSWPNSAAGWTLQTNTSLTSGNWGNYLGPVINNTATNPPLAGQLFFRLNK